MLKIIGAIIRLAGRAILWVAGVSGATQADWLRWLGMLGEWIQNPWVWVSCITIGSAAIGWDASKKYREWSESRSEDPGETDLAEALTYLRTKSAWACRQYMRLSFYESIPPSHLQEFKEQAKRKDMAITGVRREMTEAIPRRFWI